MALKLPEPHHDRVLAKLRALDARVFGSEGMYQYAGGAQSSNVAPARAVGASQLTRELAAASLRELTERSTGAARNSELRGD